MMQYKGFEKSSLLFTKSDLGDFCHRDIVCVDDKNSKKFAKDYFVPPNIYVCYDGNFYEINEIQYRKLLEFIKFYINF